MHSGRASIRHNSRRLSLKVRLARGAKKHSRTPRLAAVLSYLLPIAKLMYLS